MAILKEEEGRKVSMLVGKAEDLDNNSFPTNAMICVVEHYKLVFQARDLQRLSSMMGWM